MNNVAQPAKDTRILKLEYTVDEINTILASLQELPHRISDSIIRKTIEQVQPQIQADQPEVVEPPLPGDIDTTE